MPQDLFGALLKFLHIWEKILMIHTKLITLKSVK